MGDAIKYIYNTFLLRDLLSFITPGAIIVFSALLLYMPEGARLNSLLGYSLSFHWLLYIPLFGVFYMAGFAIQCLGEIVGFVRVHRLAKSSWCQRFKVFGRNWAGKCDKKSKSNEYDLPSFIWWVKAHVERVAFYEYTALPLKERARQRDERLVVLKQMCGNGFIALFIALFILGINVIIESFFQRFQYWPIIAVTILIIMLLPSLFWGYRVHELRLDTMNRAVQHKLEGN